MMPAFSKGDRVFAIKDLGSGFFSSSVPKGTKGKVVGVDEPFFGADTFTVKFDNDEIEEVREDDIFLDD